MKVFLTQANGTDAAVWQTRLPWTARFSENEYCRPGGVVMVPNTWNSGDPVYSLQFDGNDFQTLGEHDCGKYKSSPDPKHR